VWWASVESTTSTDSGLWRFQDLNSNGDFLGAGESRKVISAPTAAIQSPPAIVSTDDIRSVAVMANGDVIWYEDDVPAWFRTSADGSRTILFLAWTTTTPIMAVNPDFGSRIPAVSADLDRVAVDLANDTVYLADNYSDLDPFVFKCKDLNADGDVNDYGEVTQW
jgi:hypothetical protein